MDEASRLPQMVDTYEVSADALTYTFSCATGWCRTAL